MLVGHFAHLIFDFTQAVNYIVIINLQSSIISVNMLISYILLIFKRCNATSFLGIMNFLMTLISYFINQVRTMFV